MKHLITMAILLFSLALNAQVGINNTSPKATLDITAKTTGSTTAEGLIAPRLEGIDIKGKDGKYDIPQKGAIIYALSAVASPSTKTANITAEGYYYFDGSVWQKLSNSSVPAVVVTSSALNGTYVAGTVMTASNTFTVTLTNNSFSTATIAFSTSDLALSGVTGLSVASVSTASSTLIAGASVTVTYSLSGTAVSCGTLTATWSKLTLISTKIATVIPNFNCSAGSWSSVLPEYRLNGLINGTSYSGTYTLPYTAGGSGCAYAGETITQSGLTLTLPAGNYSTSGNLTYTLSGTYTGSNNGSISFTTAGGCTIYLGPCASCKEIKDKGLTTADGVYYVDIDQAGSTYPPAKAQCDMTTDGGGWTLVLNYLHKGGTSPSVAAKTNSFPIIGSTSLGIDESANVDNWGNISNSMLNTMSFSSIRFYGKTSAHSRIIHFKTSLSNGISYIKTGTGSFSGLSTSYTALSGHTAFIPGTADIYWTNFGNLALTTFPFFKDLNYHWGIDAGRPNTSNKAWEVDDYPQNASNSTYHQVWVK
ncbi:fibrinogen-like YCDxxxxGGGW domain-containing protein [Chryseobacterium sp. POE27]|uniref:fibrinogen-like YCDxxxxGGGW domain-containing protein n=1 Tax=Chryseobacterium sp. POE27 TaxID=3138177 RepID=UPI00321A8461